MGLGRRLGWLRRLVVVNSPPYFLFFLRECKVSFQCSNRTIASIILQIANSYRGITGNTSLDEAGYRKYEDYDFWSSKLMIVLIMITAYLNGKLVLDIDNGILLLT